MHLANQQGKSLEEILKLSSWEFNLWRAYYSAYPFDYEIQNIWMGRLQSTIHNCSLGADTALPPKSFCTDFTGIEEEPEELEYTELEAIANAMATNLARVHGKKTNNHN